MPIRSVVDRGRGTLCGRGFTLLEVVIVVVILSLLAAVVAPNIVNRLEKAKREDVKVQIMNLETALKLFRMDNGFYPSTEQGLAALVEAPKAGRIPEHFREGGYLGKKFLPLDPWDNPYVYTSPGEHGDFDLLSFGADGREGGDGKDADIASWEIR